MIQLILIPLLLGSIVWIPLAIAYRKAKIVIIDGKQEVVGVANFDCILLSACGLCAAVVVILFVMYGGFS